MALYSNYWHIFGVAFILIFGFSLVFNLSGKFGVTRLKGVFLYIWHTIFCLVYLFHSLENPNDAIDYYNYVKNSNVDFSFGTNSVYFLSYILVRVFDLSILGTFLVYNIFGSLGLISFAGALSYATIDKSIYIKSLSTIIIFLPSISFWSSAIGKDSISFMAIGLALWAALNLKHRFGLMVFALFTMLLVRPHMAAIMLIALAFAAFLESRVSFIKKIFIVFLTISASMVIVPFALTYAGFGDVVDVESFFSYIDTRQGYNMDGGGAIDLAGMSLPSQFFTYMFRPLFFEANSFFSLAASFDNFILLILFVSGGWSMLNGKRSGLGENRVFLWVYALLAWVILSSTTANLGIALRQKWMFAPMLIFLLISVIGRRNPLPSVKDELGDTANALAFSAKNGVRHS